MKWYHNGVTDLIMSVTLILISIGVTLISVSHDTVVSNKHEERTRHYYVIFQHKLMGKLNKPTKKLRPISESSVPTIPRNGRNSLPQPNSTTTPFLTVPQNSPPSLSCWDSDPIPTLRLEKHSSQPWKTASLLWKKLERKPLQHTTLPDGS